MLFVFLIILFACHSIDATKYRLAVLRHGLTALASDMNELAGWLRQSFEGIYVLSVEIDNGHEDSIIFPMNKQVDLFCQAVLSDANLKDGFNVLVVSQEGLIVRAAVEKCSLPAYSLITLVGIHQGVFGIPSVQFFPVPFRKLISKYAYEDAVQNAISVAGYWRDPSQLDKYLA